MLSSSEFLGNLVPKNLFSRYLNCYGVSIRNEIFFFGFYDNQLERLRSAEMLFALA